MQTFPAHAEALRVGFESFRRYVNPGIALRAELSGEPLKVVATADGALIDADGNRIEDLHGTQAFGHRNPHVAAALRAFLDSDAPSWFPSRVNPWSGLLAERLCARSGGAYDNVFFGGSGSDAVEAALKLARAATRRPRLLSIDRAYHGCTFGSCGLMAPGTYRDPFAPHLPGTEALPFGDVDALERALATKDVAAIVVEPIQVEGGVRVQPPEYLEALCHLTAQHGTLLVADEVQTGLGRTGHFLLSATWPRRPDAVLLGKHLGGGLMPISAMMTSLSWFDRAYASDNFETSEAHNSTFSGNGLACVAALAMLDLLTDDVMAHARAVGDAFQANLTAALSDLPLFDHVRGLGLIVGIRLHASSHPWLSFESFGLPEYKDKPTTGLLLCNRLYRNGFFCFVCGHDWQVLRLQPRLESTPELLDRFVEACRVELTKLSELL